METYGIVIIGSGPAGLSAAARAQANLDQGRENAPSYLLLEQFSEAAKTIYDYQYKKWVEDQPGYLPLRSDLPFKAGSRERILDGWNSGLRAANVKVRYNAEVADVQKKGDVFLITLKCGDQLQATNVILAIGMQGNPRLLRMDYNTEPFVQYTLRDPEAHKGETIAVVGAGNSGIENALALCKNNTVHLINKYEDFAKASDKNAMDVRRDINKPSVSLTCHYGSMPAKIIPNAAGDGVAAIELQKVDDKTQVERIEVDRVIARTGAEPPRAWLDKKLGIAFASESSDALPKLSNRYETNIQGMYVVGALSGCPLIKQAMNQGYDVVDMISGYSVVPVDCTLLAYQFSQMPVFAFTKRQELLDQNRNIKAGDQTSVGKAIIDKNLAGEQLFSEVESMLEMFWHGVPMFRQLSPLALRSVLIESRIIMSLSGDEYKLAKSDLEALKECLEAEAKEKMAEMVAEDPATAGKKPALPTLPVLLPVGKTLYHANAYADSWFVVVDGEVSIDYAEIPDKVDYLGMGEVFGEYALTSGMARTETAKVTQDSILIEMPRHVAMNLMNQFDSIRSGIDWLVAARMLSANFSPKVHLRALTDIIGKTEPIDLRKGKVLYKQNDKADHMYLVTKGNLALFAQDDDTPDSPKVYLGQHKAGELVAGTALLRIGKYTETAIAQLNTQVRKIDKSTCDLLLALNPKLVDSETDATNTVVVNKNGSDSKNDGNHLTNAMTAELVNKADLYAKQRSGEKISHMMASGLGEATNAFLISESLCIGCDACEVACAQTHNGVARVKRAQGSSFEHLHVPVTCRHCETPHCMKDCPPTAITRSPEGEVYIDENKCIGCERCAQNCPYDAIEMGEAISSKPQKTWKNYLGLDLLFGGQSKTVGDASASADETMAAQNASDEVVTEKKAYKCDACRDVPGGPACVQACPTGAAARLHPIQFIQQLES